MLYRLLVLVSMPLLVVAAHAADPKAKKGNVLTLNGGKASGQLSRDQLRQCLSQQKGIQEQDAQAVRAQGVLDSQKADIARLRGELDKEASELDAERAAVDTTKSEAVEAFNAKLALRQTRSTQHDGLIDAYNAKLRPFNDDVRARNQTRQTWLAECGDRSYDEADFFAIQRGK